MTVKKEPLELEKAAMVKRIRARVRAEAAIEADARLNELLPAAEKAFDDAVKRLERPSGREIASIVLAQEIR